MLYPRCDRPLNELTGDRCARVEGHEGACWGQKAEALVSKLATARLILSAVAKGTDDGR